MTGSVGVSDFASTTAGAGFSEDCTSVDAFEASGGGAGPPVMGGGGAVVVVAAEAFIVTVTAGGGFGLLLALTAGEAPGGGLDRPLVTTAVPAAPAVPDVPEATADDFSSGCGELGVSGT